MRFLSKLQSISEAAEALFWLSIAWLALDVIPGRLYLRLIPEMKPPSSDPSLPVSLTGADIDATIHRVRRSITTVSRHMPVRSVCFHRGIAVYRMLRRRKIACVLHYGVAKQGDEWKAHVWATYAGRAVMGVPQSKEFTEIATMYAA